MGYTNLNENSGTGSGERGPRGPQGINGVGISSVTTVDNNDGSLSLTVNLTDGSTQGPFVNTLVSDTLINLNKLSLEGTNDFNKLKVSKADGQILFNVDTASNPKQVAVQGSLTVYQPNPNDVFEVKDNNGFDVFKVDAFNGVTSISRSDFQIDGAIGAPIFTANSVNRVVEAPSFKADTLTVGTTKYNLPATNVDNGFLKSVTSGGEINLEWVSSVQEGVDLSSRLAVDGSNQMTGKLTVATSDTTAMDIKGTGTSILTVSGGAVPKKVTVLGNLELKNENGTIIYLATDASAQKLITTNIEVITIEGNGSNLSFNYPDVQAGQSIVKLNTDTKPFYIQSPNTTLTAPVDIINNDTDRDQIFRFLGDESSAQIIINRTNEALTIEPERLSVVRDLLTNTILNLGSTEIQSNVPYGVEDIATNKTSKLAVDRIEFSDNVAQTTAVLKYESDVVFLNKPYVIEATSGIALYVNDAGGDAKFLVDTENNTVSSFVKQRIRVNDTSAFQVQTTGGISGFSVDTVTPQVDIKYPTEIQTTSATALDIQDSLGVPNLTVDTSNGKTTVLDLDTANINTTGTNIIKADSSTALDVRTSGNVSKFSVSTLGAVSDITINGKLNGAAEGDIYYAGPGGYLTKLSPPISGCNRLSYENGLKWETQIFFEYFFNTFEGNTAVITLVVNQWVRILFEDTSVPTGIFTSDPPGLFNRTAFLNVSGVNEALGFTYVGTDVFKGMVQININVALLANDLIFFALWNNTTNTLLKESIMSTRTSVDDYMTANITDIIVIEPNTSYEVKAFRRNDGTPGSTLSMAGFKITIHRIC